ncbi:signal peptidase I [Leptospira biflexa]|jgi:signal peptidase I|uniref:Signal peptidase I n=1 Tax=Leptospira biflexa serovar Patoc (strain Patoc 1 / ATCC 23582 / Paris) TaxID=456481 RepID=B0SSU0_LEPBP|nr:signal peptidase I [Leptospira biflexa]ABZ94524.1 Signal peptidase I-related protein [Leptospira biflexa serovar Patoc strain 'Patoc 1 (Ames)']ABZ98180.1 Putative peptidase, family S26; putative signal peptide [Leptospira biflexa serovar Patoc strain 'Patoc 1 (Paris)']TGM31666.1 signal peptidase I [Leptospira biflexa]TGM39174.1 signal peptidase I [Leptospira biflexa]TGM44586.1 signal peptidase I [Leptospira biflexa]
MSKQKSKVPLKTKLIAILLPMSIGLMGALFVKYKVLLPVSISNAYMEPTLKQGTTAYFIKWFRKGNVGIGDVVIAKSPLDPNSYFIARIIGKPGDSISVQKRMVFRNGTVLDPTLFPEPTTQSIALIPSGKTEHDDMKEVTVPEKSFFLLADNREIGVDSRTLGPIPESFLFAVLW